MTSLNQQAEFLSPEEVALNQAILASLQQNVPTQQTWGNKSLMPIQTTTTTYAPVPQPRPTVQYRQPTVPVLRSTTQLTTPIIPRQSTIPIIQPTIQSTIPIIPRQSTIPIISRPPTIPVIQATQSSYPFAMPIRSTVAVPEVRSTVVVPEVRSTVVVPELRPSIPIIPPLSTTRKITIAPITPVSPRITVPPVVPISSRTTVAVPRTTFAPIQPIVPRSPGRMSSYEEEQMRLAIAESLRETSLGTSPVTIVRTPPRSPLSSPRGQFEEIQQEMDLEDLLLQEAIQASITAVEQSKLATFHANQINSIPRSPRVRNTNFTEEREFRAEQDLAYEEAMRIDLKNAENARLASEAALAASAAAEVASRKLQEAKIAEIARRETLQPPILIFPIEDSDLKDIYIIRFRLPTGVTVNHSFNRNEPLQSIIQQLRYDLKYLGNFTLTLQPNIAITCSPNTSIVNCGIANRVSIIVNYAQ
jgi:hypothetical protein